MRVCYVLNQFPELSQTFVVQQIGDVVSRGHEVDVIAARVGDYGACHTSLLSREALGGGKLSTRYTGMPESLPHRAAKGVRLAVTAAAAHSRCVATAMDISRFGWFAATGSLLTMGLPLVEDRRRYDAIVAHFGPQGVLAQGLREMGCIDGPLLTFFHAYDLTSAPRFAGRRMYRRLFEKGEVHIAISNRGASLLGALGAPLDAIRVHHMGVDVSAFGPSPKATHRSNVPNIVSVGRLVPKKGFEYGVRAIAAARARGVPISYDIFGAGPLASKLERLISCLGLEGAVRLRGAADQAQILEALRGASAFLCPSITAGNGDEEGIPMVLMEAMATELPVVATRSGAIAELISHEVNGLLVDERDPNGICTALCRLIASPSLNARFASAGRATVVAHFNLAEQGRRLIRLLDETARRSRTGDRALGGPLSD